MLGACRAEAGSPAPVVVPADFGPGGGGGRLIWCGKQPCWLCVPSCHVQRVEGWLAGSVCAFPQGLSTLRSALCVCICNVTLGVDRDPFPQNHMDELIPPRGSEASDWPFTSASSTAEQPALVPTMFLCSVQINPAQPRKCTASSCHTPRGQVRSVLPSRRSENQREDPAEVRAVRPGRAWPSLGSGKVVERRRQLSVEGRAR